MSRGVLDASALLALLNQERGSERITAILADKVVMSTVNFSEVVAKLSNDGMPNEMIHSLLDSFELEVIDFDTELAYQTGLLRPLTKHAGLSLGDRACLALAQHLRLPALTTDRVWETLSLNIPDQVIR